MLFKRSEKKTANYKTLITKVSGMHCEECAKNLQKSLSKTAGLRNVEADFSKGEVRMEFDENNTNLEKIRAGIRNIGFIPGVEQFGR